MPPPYSVRLATAGDGPPLLGLWGSLFDEDDGATQGAWRAHAHEWFARVVTDADAAHFPVVTIDRIIVATAIGTIELGVPNPQCPRGRVVRLANVGTLPDHRGNGYGSLLVRDIVQWARSIGADRVDLSATPAGQRIYEKAGFVLTSAPRMKLVL